MGWRIRVRDKEQCEEQPFLTPDLVVTPVEEFVVLDFALAEASERRNRGGLRSREGLHTAILLQLFCDARASDDEVLPDDLDPDRRGWWGDGLARAEEQGGYPLGSRLWTLRRSVLSEDTAAKANAIVVEALQPIVDQGAVATFDVTTESSYRRLALGGASTGILSIGIDGYSEDGSMIYSQKFEVLWDQLRSLRGTRRGVAF